MTIYELFENVEKEFMGNNRQSKWEPSEGTDILNKKRFNIAVYYCYYCFLNSF